MSALDPDREQLVFARTRNGKPDLAAHGSCRRNTSVAVDEGEPTSYLLLARATPVYGSDGEAVGRVKKVLCESAVDIFDGLELSTDHGERYIAAEHVAGIHAHGVDLRITREQVAQSPAPARQQRVKWDLDRPPPRLWEEIESWLLAHLPHGHQAHDSQLQAARERVASRERAQRLARENPQLAAEAGIGRPDLPGAEHGGVIDVNHVPTEVIATLPGLDTQTAERIVDVRDRIAGFSSVEDLGAILDLPADEVERLRGHVVFLPG